MKRVIAMLILGTIFLGAPLQCAVAATPVVRKHILVVMVDFPDKKGVYNPANFQSHLFSTQKRDSKNTGSVREYFRQVSYNKFTLTGDVMGWYRAPKAYSYYFPNNRWELLTWVLNTVQGKINAANYDMDKDKIIDGLIVIVPGNSLTDTTHGWEKNHRSRLNGYEIAKLCVMNELEVDNKINSTGSFTHEIGHLIGLPDLYDTDYSSHGIGSWGLMGSGSNIKRNGIGDSPCFPSAWSRKKLGWANVQQISKSQQNIWIKAAHNSNIIYQIGNGKQYFLIENRQNGVASSFDERLPGSGLLVWYIDENKSSNTNENSKLVSLIQGDGRRDLENKTNYGDRTDPLSKGANKVFSGGGVTFRIYNVSAAGSEMTFSVEMISNLSTNNLKINTNNIKKTSSLLKYKVDEAKPLKVGTKLPTLKNKAKSSVAIKKSSVILNKNKTKTSPLSLTLSSKIKFNNNLKIDLKPANKQGVKFNALVH